MVTLRNQAEINRPQHFVYQYLRDLHNLPAWNYYVKEVKRVKDGSGETFRQVRKQDEQIIRIRKAVPSELIIIDSLPGSRLQFKRELNLRSSPGGSILEDHFEVDTGAPQWMQRIFRSKMESAVKQNLLKLKRLLETGEVRLQDGRVSRLNQFKIIRNG